MQPRPNHGFQPVFCTIVPPHLLDKLSQADDPVLAAPARRTLEADGARRHHRQLTALAFAPHPPRTADPVPSKPHRTLYDCRHGTDLPGHKVRDEGDEPTQDASVNRAYAGLGATFELLLAEYGRSSIDGKGLPLIGSVHYDEKYNNAFFDGEQMVFGDGDGEVFLDFTLAIDVIAHELTHGLTQYTANLAYQGQSGALNESVSDVFGSLVKQYSLGQSAEQADWLIGADILAPRVSGDALRSMKAPGTAYDDDVLGKDPQPASMDDYVETQEDNGGVHINSGIPNRAFHLLATALGGNAWERAGRIWFDVLTGGELAQNADFASFARLTVAAARSRFGEGDEAEAVLKAWSEVGVATR
ncbi:MULTISPECIES: M4 family metallopeptidase [unclassified Streptomyces]|uniref:Neutral metalloproteinase n=2 Tax=Streptomyces TaxID=1883 RepID=A0ABV8MX94_9ACTN|nr:MULTISPECIES: M4 family metallopeptidase [unclassified Streptomyces]HBF81507.1 M4 family peptidase [Streptomyces sp.]AEN09854.1 peptidase M4 thermolysin [Streptomyces sp. SirexAA-E]MBK3591951.1 M4 family metallopeptidase [Streptomyces sp. MBT51]MYR64814.1 peptidase M4 family protein [Streptomyces sp. SID4939]MYS01572.1 peptidase M4 family protein [Streptomyces sp. SID4940]